MSRKLIYGTEWKIDPTCQGECRVGQPPHPGNSILYGEGPDLEASPFVIQ